MLNIMLPARKLGATECEENLKKNTRQSIHDPAKVLAKVQYLLVAVTMGFKYLVLNDVVNIF